jgi:inosose dehydratase
MIRVANAPCSWGVLEFAGAVEPAGYGTVLDEIRATGYDGTELGDWGFMPTDPARLGAEIAARNLELVGAFVPIAFADAAAHEPGEAVAVKTARLMRDAGAVNAFIVLSDNNGTVPVREQHAGRITAGQGLTETQWQTFAAGVDRVARAVWDATGLRSVFHPHCGGYVETPEEIDELMRRTDPTKVGLVFDTGHILYGGGDPETVLARHRDRVWHVHFKDCDRQVAEAARAQRLGYLDAVRRQLFCELGAGAVDFAAIVRRLRGSSYDGWIVVEQDVFPGYGTPRQSAQKSRDYLRSLGV